MRAFVAWLAASFAAAALGGIATLQAPEFYAELVQPEWAPPGWVFGPVWTTLYFLMGVAAWRVWRKDRFGFPIYLFVVQLAFNALWSWLFFAWRMGGAAFLEVVLLWALIVATVPVWLLLLDGLRPGGQPWTTRVWIGTAIGLAGVALVARPERGVEAGHWPAIIGLQVACLSWVVGSLYAQATPKRLPLASAAAIEMLAGSIALAAFALVFREDPSVFASASPRTWGAIVYLVVFGSLVGFTAFAYCLNELPATTVGTYAYVNPVVAVILGWLILRESLTPGLLAGGALIVLSVILTTLRKPNARS